VEEAEAVGFITSASELVLGLGRVRHGIWFRLDGTAPPPVSQYFAGNKPLSFGPGTLFAPEAPIFQASKDRSPETPDSSPPGKGVRPRAGADQAWDWITWTVPPSPSATTSSQKTNYIALDLVHFFVPQGPAGSPPPRHDAGLSCCSLQL
jgi:hypothetical protein